MKERSFADETAFFDAMARPYVMIPTDNIEIRWFQHRYGMLWTKIGDSERIIEVGLFDFSSKEFRIDPWPMDVDECPWLYWVFVESDQFDVFLCRDILFIFGDHEAYQARIASDKILAMMSTGKTTLSDMMVYVPAM